MSARRKTPPGRCFGTGSLFGCTLGSSALAYFPVGRLARLLAATGVLLLLAVLAIVALGAALASKESTCQASARTLHLLLRLAPRYAPRQ